MTNSHIMTGQVNIGVDYIHHEHISNTG